MSLYDHLTEDLGEGLTQAELYTWATRKRSENLDHRQFYPRHEFCRNCDNCTLGDSRWRCLCANGRKMVTPYRIRFTRAKDKQRYG